MYHVHMYCGTFETNTFFMDCNPLFQTRGPRHAYRDIFSLKGSTIVMFFLFLSQKWTNMAASLKTVKLERKIHTVAKVLLLSLAFKTATQAESTIVFFTQKTGSASVRIPSIC